MQLAWNNPTPQLNLFFVRDMKVLLAICFSVLGLTALEVWVFTRPPALRVKALRMHFHFVLSALILVSARYVWRRLNALIRTKHLLHPGTLFKIVILFLLVMAQFTTVCVVLLAQTDPLRMSLIISFCLGSLLFMTFCMIVADICSFIYRKILCRKNRDSEFDRTEIKIRVLLSLIGALILIVAGLLCVTNLNVEHVTVPIKGLSPLYNGTTIVQISDIHLGPFNGKSRLHSIVQKVNDLQGDVVVITGDLVDSTVEALKEAVQPLKELKTKYGSYYITGNVLVMPLQFAKCHSLRCNISKCM